MIHSIHVSSLFGRLGWGPQSQAAGVQILLLFANGVTSGRFSSLCFSFLNHKSNDKNGTCLVAGL